jgi:hypothetical protein
MSDDDVFNGFPPELAKICKLHHPPTDLPELADRLEILRSIVFRSIQEIEALKRTITQHDAAAAEQHQRTIVETMLHDHSAAGPTPWRRHSYASYILSELEYLRWLGLTDEEVGEFNRSAQAKHQQT